MRSTEPQNMGKVHRNRVIRGEQRREKLELMRPTLKVFPIQLPHLSLHKCSFS